MDRVIQIGNYREKEDRKFDNPQCGRVYSVDGLSPTINTCQGGDREPKILLKMEDKEIIPYNTPEYGVAPTITTMYARLGTNNLTPGEYGGAMGIMEVSKDTMEERRFKDKRLQSLVESGKIDPEKVQYLDTFNQSAHEDVAGYIKARIDQNNAYFVTEPTSCASRKRGDEHKIETRKDDLANCVTSIDTDSMVAEPQVLTPLRTEEGRQLRKQGIEKFSNRALYPREDGVSNTITSVQKDNLLQEPKIVGYSRDKKGKIVNHHFKDIANTITGSSTQGNSTSQYVAEGMEYKGKLLKEGDAVDTGRSKTFGTHVMDGVAPTLRGVHSSEIAACVNDGGMEYKGKFIKEGDRVLLNVTDNPNYIRGGLDGVSRTIKAEHSDAGTCVREGARYRIRKLTEREVFRLMDVSEEDIDKIQAAGISKTAMYKLAGNSIVVSCLYHIFRKCFIEPGCEDQQLSLF